MKRRYALETKIPTFRPPNGKTYRRGLFVLAQTGDSVTIRNDDRFQPRGTSFMCEFARLDIHVLRLAKPEPARSNDFLAE